MMKVLVFIEKNTHTDMLRNVTAELTWKAHSLVKPLNGEVVGIFAGDKLPQDHAELFKYGMDRILYFNHPQLKNLKSIAMKNILTEMVKSENADIVLFGATHTGRDVAPLIASTLRTGLTADCTQLYIDEYKESGKILYQVRPAFGGNILATIITPFNRPMMATVREGVMLLPEVKLDNPAKLQEFKTEFKMEWIKNEFLEIIPKVSKVNFGEANIIVAGGAGVGCRENFRLLEQLAAVLNAEVGASRAAVDFGFAEKER